MKKTALYIAFGALSLAALPSCNKFLDVQPKGTLLQEVQFSSLQGYYDAFYGVYGTMAKSDLYGQRMTNGFVDELAQMFGSTAATSTSVKTRAYNYTDVSVQAEIYSLWLGQYQVISYVNNILANLESPSFSSSHLSQLKGEALGLRAFLHFDLVRLFAEDYQRGKDSRGIPYSYDFNLKNRTVYTVAGTYENILKDLDEAERLLSDIDETVSLDGTQSTDFWSRRAVHFNKYAVYATKARVYQAMGNSAKAAEYAKKVTDHTASFKLAGRNSFESVRRFPATGELIFGLYANSFLDDFATRFLKNVAGTQPKRPRSALCCHGSGCGCYRQSSGSLLPQCRYLPAVHPLRVQLGGSHGCSHCTARADPDPSARDVLHPGRSPLLLRSYGSACRSEQGAREPWSERPHLERPAYAGGLQGRACQGVYA